MKRTSTNLYYLGDEIAGHTITAFSRSYAPDGQAHDVIHLQGDNGEVILNYQEVKRLAEGNLDIP